MELNKNVPTIRFNGFEDEWEEKEFKENIVSIQTGTNLLGSTTNSGTPLIKMGNLQRGYFSFEKVEYLSQDSDVEKENIVNFGDFLFNTRNTLELVGKGATWMGESGQFAFNNNIARFIFKGIDTVFFNYLYNTQFLLSQVQARAMGTTSVAAIYPQNLNSIVYGLPQFPEQTQIGNFFRTLDGQINAQEQKHQKLVNLKKAMLEKMFPKEGTDVPEIRFNGFTEKWEEKKLGDVVEFYSGLTYSPKDVKDSKHTLVLRSSNVKNNNIVLNDNVYVDNNVINSSNVKKGDIIVVVRNGSRNLIGKHAEIKAEMPNTVIGAFMTGVRYNISNFLNAILDSNRFTIEIEKNLGATINQITNGSFKAMLFRFPSLEEQQKIGEYFEKLDNLIQKSQVQIGKYKNIKQALLQKMFV